MSCVATSVGGDGVKIALLSYELPPDTGFGGIGTYTWYQARALVRLGHDVRVVAGALEPGRHHSEVDGVKITRVLDDGPFTGAIRGMLDDGLGWAPNRIRTASGAFHALRDLLEQESYDVVEYPECGGDGMIVSTMLPVRTCVRFHSPAALIMGSYPVSEADLEATSFLEQIGIDQADVRTAPSTFMASEVVDRLGVTTPVHVIPNGIDLGSLDSASSPEVVERFELPTRPDLVTVLFASRLERRKGAHLLAEVCAQVLGRDPRVHFLVAGADVDGLVDGVIRPRLAAEGLDDRFRYLNRLALPEVRELLKHVDVQLLPTTWDNAPYACLEAMAAGVAVVTSDLGGMPEMIEHERTGLLSTPHDPHSFATNVLRLADDRALRERLGAQARAEVEARFTDTAMARATVELWRSSFGLGA